MFEKANHSQDPKNRITPPGSPFFRTLRILRLRPQNPEDPKKRITGFLSLCNMHVKKLFFKNHCWTNQ